MVGKKYLQQFGAGSAPRVLFVPEEGPGKIGPPIETGNPVSVTHACKVFARATESGDDFGRFDAVYALEGRLIDLIATAGTGRITWGKWADASPVDVDAYGADIEINFTFTRDVRHDPARWALPAADVDVTPAPLSPPSGIPATTVVVNVTTTPPS
jgi:hypothetical protein